MRDRPKPKAAAARTGAALGRRKRAELLDLLRPCFARTEPWLQAGKYAAAVMRPAQTERVDDRRAFGGPHARPDPAAAQPGSADTWAAMGVVRWFAVAALDEAAARTGRRCGLAVGAIDETGQVKGGGLTAGIKGSTWVPKLLKVTPC